MLGNLRGFEWVIIGALVLLLFGAKRLPDAARGLGRSLRIFKAETKGLVDDGAKPDAAPTEPAAPAVQAAPAASAEATAPPAAPAPPGAPAPERTEG